MSSMRQIHSIDIWRSLDKLDSLTESRIKIIMIILLNQKFDNNSNALGVSSYDLRRNGVPGRTFDINREFLLNNKILRIVKKEKTGKQIRKYFDVTPLGFFYFLKTIENREEFEEVNKKILLRFLPKIATYWTELEKLYGNLLFALLRDALACINIKYYLVTLKNEKRESVEGFWLVTDIPTADLHVDIVLRKRLLLPSKHHNIDNDTFSDIVSLGNEILKQLTFFFFFNLINNDLHELYISELARRYLQNKPPTKEVDSDTEKYCKKIRNNLTSASKKTSEIVRNDKELLFLFKEILKEISAKLESTNIKLLNRNLLGSFELFS